jgi:hypothetical protein
LRELARVSKAKSECRRALSVAARSVPTVTPLAIGERMSGLGKRESFLITRSLEGTTPLNVFVQQILPGLDAPRQASIRNRLAIALGEFLARMHEAGIVHHDLHAGNVLVALTESNELRLHLVDLHSVRMGRPLSWRASRSNLVVFNRWFVLHVNRTDRLRCWHAYYRARCESCYWPLSAGFAPQDIAGALARDLATRTHESLERFWRQRDQRSLRTNRYYRRVRGRGVAGHVVADLDPSLVTTLLADPDEPFRRASITILKDSRSSKVVELDLVVNGEPRRVIYKRFECKSRIRPWLSLLRRPPALRSWINGHSLRERCLPTARPLAALHRRRSGLFQQGYLLSLKIQDTVELPRFLDDLASLPREERRAVLRTRIEQTARLIRDLHQRGVSQRDLKGANILTKVVASQGLSQVCAGRGSWIGEPASTTPDVSIIDLVGVKLPRQVRQSRRVQNLARLNASVGRHPALTRTDLLRFLRVYLQWGLRGQDGWKSWWRAIAAATEAKQQRNAQSGRPLH